MVAKQCHSRLKLIGVVNHREKRYEPSFSHDRVSPTMSSLTATTNTSPCVQSTIVTPPSNKFDKPLWRRRRATGPGMMHLSAATLMSTRELSTSSRTFQYDPPSGVSRSENRKLFFDTHAVVRLFEDNGFTTQQAEVMVKVLVRMTNSTMDVIYNDMVTKVQQEIMLQHVMSQIVSVKKDMIILEKSEFSTLLTENEKLKIQLLEFRVHLSDDMNKVRSETMLDMNLEKSRMKEMKADHDRKLMETRTGIMEMSAEQDRHLTQTDMKIDTEVAGLKTMLEAHKLDTIKYLAGSVFTCLTVVLGFYRIWM